MQELWLRLATREWSSLAVVPAHATGADDDLAGALADVGTALSDLPVSAVTVRALEAGSARILASLARDVRGRKVRLLPGGGVVEMRTFDRPEEPRAEGGLLLPRSGQLIIGVPSVVAEPVALAVVHAADAVVLAVRLGVTGMKDLRRSVELIGRERIAGCVLV